MTWRFVPATTVSGELVLSSNLRTIEAEAFAGITASTVRIPTGCTRIGSGAFRNCANLTAVYIPATVSYIADDAFEGCANVVIYGKSGSAAIQYANRIGLQYALY